MDEFFLRNHEMSKMYGKSNTILEENLTIFVLQILYNPKTAESKIFLFGDDGSKSGERDKFLGFGYQLVNIDRVRFDCIINFDRDT